MVLGNSDNIKGRKKATKKTQFHSEFLYDVGLYLSRVEPKILLAQESKLPDVQIKGTFLLLPERFKLCTMVNMMYTKLNDAQRYQSTFPGLSVADMDYSPFQLAPSENQNMVKPK